MPLLAIVVPPHLTSEYPHIRQALLENTKRLAVPYDLHEVLVNILKSDFRKQEIRSISGENKTAHIPRGISLLTSTIPTSRTCKDASINELFCPCAMSREISTTGGVVQKIAKYLVVNINSILSAVTTKCAALNLKNVESAHILDVNKKTGNFTIDTPEPKNNTRYIVVINTVPGDGMFESTVLYKFPGNLRVLGTILRINTFGNQSYCVSERFLKSYCFCHGVNSN